MEGPGEKNWLSGKKHGRRQKNCGCDRSIGSLFALVSQRFSE
jgi:hypothetical protein